MGKARKIWKKLFMLFIAGVIVFSGATEVFADGNSDSGNVMLEENDSGNFNAEAMTGTTVDYSDLEHQITIAIGLNEHEYTTESWTAMREALNEGIKLLDNASIQQDVIDATDKLKNSIAGLVKMDYSQLEKSLGLLYNKIDENAEIHAVIVKVDSAINKAKGLLLSGDQAAVDEAVAELNVLIEELSEIKTGEPETIVKEIEVEVPPSDDYCNIAGHKAWPVLFAISLVLNIALIVMMGYIFSKMKNSEDDIPLVSYDIDDDIDDFEEYDDFDDYSEEEFDDEADEYVDEAFAEESGENED